MNWSCRDVCECVSMQNVCFLVNVCFYVKCVRELSVWHFLFLVLSLFFPFYLPFCFSVCTKS